MELEETGYIEERRNARKSYRVFYMQFVKGFDVNNPKLFCFFEGKEDPKYYNARIRTKVLDEFRQSIIKVETEYIICEGKNNVLKIAELVDNNDEYNNFKNTWTMFFVDKDCDNVEDLKKNNVYVTPCYSIENLYLSTNTFDDILKCEFSLNTPETIDNFNTAKRIYEETLEQFNDVMEEFNAYLYVQRKRQAQDPSFRMDLKDIKNLDDFCEINLGTGNRVIKKDYMSELKRRFPHLRQITQNELEEQKIFFRTVSKTKIFRGKYLILFLRKVLEKLKTEMVKRESLIFSTRVRVSLIMPEDISNIISQLSQYAETPNCLHEFLSKIYENIRMYINEKILESL